jgi:hypothetical protein
VLIVAFAWMIVTLSVGAPSHALLYGERACAWAFGASWFAKGAEVDVLFGRPRAT